MDDPDSARKSAPAEAIIEAYETARLEAAAQTLLEDDTFPLECPYSFTDITEREIHWPPTD